jgi:multiple sugar transport system substrate-binding protein
MRWFIGLGAAERTERLGIEQAVVDRFNREHDPSSPDYVAGNADVVLSLEIGRNADAVETLAIQIANGEAPDVIGPIGVRGLWKTVGERALKLTIDQDGNDATSPDFDPASVVRYGLDA